MERSVPSKHVLTAAGLVLLFGMSQHAQALTVNQTTDAATLLNALVPDPSQFAGISASYTTGAAAQVGTYTGFASPPVTIGDGMVLSTGNAVDTVGPASPFDIPDTDVGGGSTPEIDAYAPGHITNWGSSHDAAALRVDFTLASPTAVAFDFIFGSIEYPNFVDNFTDAAYVFLDGTQITFDQSGNPVQVGSSFATSLTTADTNSAFADPHGLIGPLTTNSGQLSAGPHTILFEVADTNDHALDSALFLSNFRTATPVGLGPCTGDCTEVPEPASLASLGTGMLSLTGIVWLRRRTRRS
jgi:hypothetical protein